MPIFCCCGSSDCPVSCNPDDWPDFLTLDLSAVLDSDCASPPRTPCEGGDASTTTITVAKHPNPNPGATGCFYYSCTPICFANGDTPGRLWAYVERFYDSTTIVPICGWAIRLQRTDPSDPFNDDTAQYFQMFTTGGPVGSYNSTPTAYSPDCNVTGTRAVVVTEAESGDTCDETSVTPFPPWPSLPVGEEPSDCPSDICDNCCLTYTFTFTGTGSAVWDGVPLEIPSRCPDFLDWVGTIESDIYTINAHIVCSSEVIEGETIHFWYANFDANDVGGNQILLKARLRDFPNCPPTNPNYWTVATGTTFSYGAGGGLSATIEATGGAGCDPLPP